MNALIRHLPLMILAAATLLTAQPARAQDPAQCAPGVTDDTLRPLPPYLTDRAIRLFGLRNMPADQVQRTTVVRCFDGGMLACNLGANLPCGKANTSRTLPQAAPWCQQNPDADYIPAYISGHDSIYHWRCLRGAPVATGQPEVTDSSGFIMSYWQPIQ